MKENAESLPTAGRLESGDSAWNRANRVLVQAQADKSQAEYRLIFQRVLLEYATGTLKD